VNLKDVDLKDFFRLIHEISGLNVVLDPSVHGTVTLVLDQVPWDQALDIVLRNNSLTKEIDGNVLRIATQDTLKREADQRRELQKAESEAVDMVTVTRVLNYAQANTMVGTLKKFLTSRGDVFADVRSNTLIIRDIPSSIPKIDNLLRQIDRKSQQVEIDARVVQTSRNFAREIGTEFGFSVPTGAAGNTAIGGLVGSSALLSPVIHSIAAPFSSGGAGGSQIPLNTSLGATAPTSGFTFATQGHNYAIDFVLSLMENRGVGKILSEPKGITQNNEKLTVKQGQQIPIQTNINNTISTQYVDAVLKLEVTPQITAEGTVFLDVTIENTQIDKSISVQGEPGLDTQSTQTKVIVADGGTVVIGGVVITNQNTTIDQVPLLGNVPLIGNLFKHTSISVSTQELMFFVTPRILPG
jgi:type IV pilus assembly protein PilQ